jgi:hypothetical protein
MKRGAMRFGGIEDLASLLQELRETCGVQPVAPVSLRPRA